jgi:hypothetical protein
MEIPKLKKARLVAGEGFEGECGDERHAGLGRAVSLTNGPRAELICWAR